jgi:hypothetical protein
MADQALRAAGCAQPLTRRWSLARARLGGHCRTLAQSSIAPQEFAQSADDLAKMETTMSLSISGGGSLPAIIGWFTASTPLVRLTADDQGLTLDLRPPLLRRAVQRLIDPPPAPGEPCWIACWAEISSVDVAPRSIAVYLERRRGCRFVVLRGRKLAALLRQIESHEVPTRHVSGTIRWFFRRDTWVPPT